MTAAVGDEGKFVADFGEAVSSGSAALFVGAGLSMAAGYPSWRTLLKNIASELKLSANEPDLIAVAQYHINENTGSTAGLLRELVRVLGDDRPLTDVHRLLARLPISTVWTTNYDRLIERSYRAVGKRVDVKHRQAQLSVFDRHGDISLLKMHGSIDDPAEIVIAREHYELYGSNRDLFQRMLLTDLVRRTFLFVGLSFTDPNLLTILGLIRATLRENAPRHWALMLAPTPDEDEDPALVARRHELFVADLKRYGLRVITLREPAEQTALIGALEARVARRAVFVSGSYPSDARDDLSTRVREIARGAGTLLAARRLTLVNGFGLTVGSEVVSGFLEYFYEEVEAPAPRVILRPFPRDQDADFIQRYRRDMVSQAGIVIVIGGVHDGKVAQGVMDEVTMARERGRPIIPVGVTGGAARLLWGEMVETNPHEFDVGALHNLGDAGLRSDAVIAALDRILGNLIA